MSSCRSLQYGRDCLDAEVTTPAKLTRKFLLALFTLILLLGIMLCLGVWTVVLVACQAPPKLALQHLSVHNMAVYQDNTTTASPSFSWQVDSGFNVTLHTRNRNKLAGCSTTLRTMSVDVKYKNEPVLHQEVPLGFGLKPLRSRPVVMELRGDHVHLKKELGPVMEAELRSGNIGLDFSFSTRYLRNDRKPISLNMGCRVTASTPANPAYVGGGSVWEKCRLY